jgi:hypothetical protein
MVMSISGHVTISQTAPYTHRCYNVHFNWYNFSCRNYMVCSVFVTYSNLVCGHKVESMKNQDLLMSSRTPPEPESHNYKTSCHYCNVQYL